MRDADSPIPISLVTGFLGAGKSTLINRILAAHPELRFGLVINEFGNVGLESQIIQASEEEVFELSNGCMCCVVRSDMKDAVRSLVGKAGRKIDHILMEASGLSDPAPIAQTFLEDDLDGAVRLAQILCLVDAENFRRSVDDFEITQSQLLNADLILLSKIELADLQEIQATTELVGRFAPDVPVYQLDHQIPLELAFDGTASGAGRLDELELEAAHHDHVDWTLFRADRPVSLDALMRVLRDLPDGVVRAKGFLATQEDRDTKVILQLAGARRELEGRDWEPGEPRQSALLFVGKGFDAPALEKRLRECETPGIQGAE